MTQAAAARRAVGQAHRASSGTAWVGPAGRGGPVRRTRPGFTLLELILVISTILFLLGVLIVVAGSAHLDAQERTTRRVIDALESACVVYYQLHGAYPRREYHPGATGTLLYECLTGEESGRAVSSIPEGMIERDGSGNPYFVDAWRNRILYLPFAPQGLTSTPSASHKDESRKWAMNGGVPLFVSYGPDGKGWDYGTMEAWTATDLRDCLYLEKDPEDNQDNITNFRDIPLEYIP